MNIERIVVFTWRFSLIGEVQSSGSCPISPGYWGCNRSLFKDIFDIVLFIFLGQTTSEDKYYRTRRR